MADPMLLFSFMTGCFLDTLRLVVEKAKRQINQVNIVSIYVYMVSLWLLEHDELLVTKALRKFLFFLRLNKLS